ncbi:MAG TPA: HAD family hydrolase, partial [Candidatus Binataceae bacterium]|nr:HAD family hydrolase [Candidatus Binataceae bacterium]
MASGDTVFLFDVDNTLVDNDRIQADMASHLEREIGAERNRHYWTLFEELRTQLGYADYLGALQRYRIEFPRDFHILEVSDFLINYPFANRLYANSLDVVERCRQFGRTVIVSDGDVVFQPLKVRRAGLFDAFDGNVLIYIHKEFELDDIAARHPAAHYVFIDDKLR